MAVPPFEEFIDPVFRIIVKSAPISRSNLRVEIVKALKLTEEDIREQVKSGRLPKWKDRTNWSVSYLKAAGLIEYLKRGVYGPTDLGKKVHATGKTIDILLLKNQDSFIQFISGSKNDSDGKAIGQSVPAEISNAVSPQENFYSSYVALRNQTLQEILNKLKQLEPSEFETLVVELMIKLGYGTEADVDAFVTGQSGDEGIDGIVHLDKLGLEKVYLQAKKYTDATIGRPDIQKFVGALEGKKAKKGVFITTTGFSKEAREYANTVKSEIALLDGPTIAGLMFDNDLGVSVERELKIKKIDSDYFDSL
jgi:restriction system protein